MGVSTVLHIPHSSRVIPADLRDTILLSDGELAQELAVMTDHFTDEFFAGSPVETGIVRFPVSRLVVDPERFLDDALEPMAARGMGVIYERTSDGKPLRAAPTEAERSFLIDRFYRPHHRALEADIERALAESGGCLLLDCHSFPSQPIPCDIDPMADRPDFCLGTDPTATPGWLVSMARAFLDSRGLTVAINRPYAGVLVPERFSHRGSGVSALMVEVNRRLYLDERTCSKSRSFPDTAATIRQLVRRLTRESQACAGKSPTRLAVETREAGRSVGDREVPPRPG